MNLTLPKTDDPLIANHVEGMRFRANIEGLLKRVREGNPELKGLLKSKAEYERYDKLGETWLGLYNKDTQPFLYIGIQLTDHDKPRYEMFVQVAWPNRPSEKAKMEDAVKRTFESCIDPDPSPYLVLRRPIRPDYDGEPEKMVEWLGQAGVEVSKYFTK